jgi:hypothetical protein
MDKRSAQPEKQRKQPNQRGYSPSGFAQDAGMQQQQQQQQTTPRDHLKHLKCKF